MRNSETRTLNQCTLVRLQPPPSYAYRMAVPKLQIAMIAFANTKDARAVVAKLVPPPAPELARALESLWNGDLVGFARDATPFPLDDVTALAQRSLALEQSLLAAARGALQSSANDLMTKKAAFEALDEALQGSPATGNLSVDRLRALLVPELAAAGTSTANAVTFEGRNAKDTSSGQAVHSALHQMIQARAPEIAAFLVERKILAPINIQSSAASKATSSSPLDAVELQLAIAAKKQGLLATLASLARTPPVGYLALERINFTALGYVRGELVYSLPLLPGETVRLSHREWSRTEQEYSSLVQSSIEKDLEQVLSEKSELTESYGSQEQHTSAFNASATVSGGYGSISFSSSLGYSASNAESSTRQTSARRAQENSRKAASRAKQEHKVSFHVATKLEIEEQNFREVKNESVNAVRWDFHRLMKKWRLDLYRYGARLTYDLVVPEPGSYLLRRYLLLRAIETELARPMAFDVSVANISTNSSKSDPNSWLALQDSYGASLEPPPTRQGYSWEQAHAYQGSPSDATHFLELTLPEGYEFDLARCNAAGSSVTKGNDTVGILNEMKSENISRMSSTTPVERFAWRYYVGWSGPGEPHADSGDQLTITVSFEAQPGERLLLDWKAGCCDRLREAAQARYALRQQQLTAARDALHQALTQEDSLMLRKLEKEELMKAVLRWLLGPGFEFYPSSLMPLSLPAAADLALPGDLDYYGGGQAVVAPAFESMLQHGEVVEFLNQAIEWENVNYVLYPYFWTDDSRWDFKQSLVHPEYFHRLFLRAGAARVVLPIRPGWERQFVAFSETLRIDGVLPDEANHPYMTIASEIEAMSLTTYAYTESPNKESEANLVKHWFEFTPTGALDVVGGEVLLTDEDLDA